jgi:polar amino acid transport system substrate-binding protein
MSKIAFLVTFVSAFVGSTTAMAETKLNLVKDGELQILTSPTYPPMEFVNTENGELNGVDIDLGNAIGKKLNLNVTWIKSTFQQLQSSLQTGRADMIISGMSDNPKRQESMDFIDYITSGPILFTTTANASKYKVTTDLCGKTVAGSRVTTFPDNVKAWSAANCAAKGKADINVESVADSNAARMGMKQGRYDAAVQGVETIAYQMRLEPNTFVMVGAPILSNDVFGIGFKKTNPQLRDAVAKALDQLIKDGTYSKILNKWGLIHNAVAKVEINGAK